MASKKPVKSERYLVLETYGKTIDQIMHSKTLPMDFEEPQMFDNYKDALESVKQRISVFEDGTFGIFKINFEYGAEVSTGVMVHERVLAKTW